MQTLGVQVPLPAPKKKPVFSLARNFIILLRLLTRMKGIKLFFAVCLGIGAAFGANATDSDATARAATRRTSGTVSTRGAQSAATARGTAPSTQTSQKASQNPRNRASTNSRDTATNASAITSGRSAITAISPRTTSTVQSRATAPATTAKRVITRTATAPARTTSRTTTTATTNARTTRTAGVRATTARAATDTATTQLTASDIINRDYKKCREVYYNCMDEFCANKDSQLKRCACSSRVNEFDSAKKNLSTVEEKMLDFNQRLLTVNMDKEDAAALNKATEGETAFHKKDTSKSKQMLDEIAKKLNTSFNDSNFNQSLGAISLSLNADAAFDTVDSLSGASTTAKTGTALYSAALPICREMAAEVCTDDELPIVESGYQMTIEQDCNTVAKSYETQNDQAREKLREGSALLDMSRLDIYQKRNSDDILTCKQKMLTMLTDSTVCGTNLDKCLDTTGRYIDPSTGEAFLTSELSNLSNLISRPDTDQSWTSVPGNQAFVSYLNSKKKFLEPAMENCQDIADSVWDAFVEDALAQIKLAQDSKLEEVRQSCTTLTAQCLTDTAKTLQDFDARALSTFGVAADRTVNAMCADVRNACSALLKTTGGDVDWNTGVSDITTDKTYDTVMQTCREIGRACIIQSCKSISGNFGLCENIQTSVNRKSIINRTACWDEVKECVASAGSESVENIWARLLAAETIQDGTFYNMMYGYEPSDNTPIYDICAADKECEITDSTECKVCRISERLWGNCEYSPVTLLQDDDSHNKIIMDGDTETLLKWFAKNTGTSQKADSCRDTSCAIGFIPLEDNGTISCLPSSSMSSDGKACADKTFVVGTNNDGTKFTNCCQTNKKDAFGNCCASDTVTINDRELCLPASSANGVSTESFIFNNNDAYYPNASYKLVCTSGDIIAGGTPDPANGFPSGNTVTCKGGRFVLITTQFPYYVTPQYTGKNTYSPYPAASYNADPNTVCTMSCTKADGCKFEEGEGVATKADPTKCLPAQPTHWLVTP